MKNVTITEVCTALAAVADKLAPGKLSVVKVQKLVEGAPKPAQAMIILAEATYINKKFSYARADRMPTIVRTLDMEERCATLALCEKILGAS